MVALNGSKTNESTFQNELIEKFIANGWLRGSPKKYNRNLALYEEDLLGFVKETQDKHWQKFCKLYPNDPEKKFLERVASQLNKADPGATHREMRTFGTLGVLRHEIRDRGSRFSLCQFKPEHELNPETLNRFKKNRFRIVPELVYSPWVSDDQLKQQGLKAKAWRIDLVLFVNGLPVITIELKSEFKQAVQKAVHQYKTTRFAKDPVTNKPEPLLTFKRGALVHFAVSQYEVYMATKLDGEKTFFLPFNKGTAEGGSGNDVPDNIDKYATDYLWNEVLLPDNLLKILARYIHLQIEEKEGWEGLRYKEEKMIFPRFHQWDVVNKLLMATKDEGPGQKYLIQHSAGSGKSNSIAWVAHQLSSLYNTDGKKIFDSVIVITDRTVLDSQLQDTIYQFEHVDGIVQRISKQEGQGSKSEKLARALGEASPIIIVTIQTFPHVLNCIESDISLKERCYAVIADEAHSSQTGTTARKLKEALMIDSDNGGSEPSTEETLELMISSRRALKNLSYFAFTATPKGKTLEVFGRPPNPNKPPSKTNKPVPYHIYSMRQAIEEGFIIDVLKNYTNYKVAYNLALKIRENDQEVESKKARVKMNQWVRLHDYNIAQKAQVIIEHFKDNIIHLLGGQAKAMIITSSRKEAVRYKLQFDKYIRENSYQNIYAMVAFSGDVEFSDKDPNASGLIGEKFTEKNMNSGLKGREMRKAFDSDDYQVMIVANKFQTGFDQPKICAMYIDKKLRGVDCVQTLSRMNRTYPGKNESGVFVLDFINEPDDILKSFQPFYQTAELSGVTDPDLVFDLYDKLRGSTIFEWNDVEKFCTCFLQKNKSNAALANICKSAVEKWNQRYRDATDLLKERKILFERSRKSGDPVLIANAENSMNECSKEKDSLEVFKKDLGSYVRFYEFMSQIVDYDDKNLEKLSLYARYLGPMLREVRPDEEDVDLSNVTLSHYRLSKIRQQKLKLHTNSEDSKLDPSKAIGTAKARAKRRQEEHMSQIINRLNELFETDKLTKDDMVNYAFTIRDKISENELVMKQVENNTSEQALLGEFPKAVEEAIMDSSEAHQNQMMQLLSNPDKMSDFVPFILDLVKQRKIAQKRENIVSVK